MEEQNRSEDVGEELLVSLEELNTLPAEQPERNVSAEKAGQPEMRNEAFGKASAEAHSKRRKKKEPEPDKRYPQALRTVFDYLETFCYVLSVLIILFLFFFRYVSVDGDSMLPTLHGAGQEYAYHADRLIISNFLYTPKTGDIVVLNVESNADPLIKRVIAVGGQTVRIDFKNWIVQVDGVTLHEDYISRGGGVMRIASMEEMYGLDENGVCEFTVKEGKVFVMGDNRNNSRDSRFSDIGELDVDCIMGRVILRLFPFEEFGSVS